MSNGDWPICHSTKFVVVIRDSPLARVERPFQRYFPSITIATGSVTEPVLVYANQYEFAVSSLCSVPAEYRPIAAVQHVDLVDFLRKHEL